METETWYILEDGTNGDPREIAADKKGVLRHKDGRAVDYAPHGPRSRSVDPAAERAKAEPKAEPKGKELKPEEPKASYQTRDAKAR